MALSTIQNNSFADTAVHGRRNLLINGAMTVAQRGTKALTGNPEAGYACDRFEFYQGGDADVTISQSTDAPSGSGFANSLKFDVVTADTSLGAGEIYVMRQKLEGQDLQGMKKGTSSAESVTLQFWIKSSKTGTYILELFDIDNTRQISKSYTVSSANTWEQKFITFEGDTSGVLDNDNARSLDVQWWIAAGSDYTSGTLSTTWTANTSANRAVGQVNALDNASNEIYITGVQLEVGEQATPFEHRSYADELRRCQRYAYKIGGSRNDTFGAGQGLYQDGNEFNFGPYFPPVTLRANPSLTAYGTAPGIKINGGANTGFTPTISGPFNEMQFIRLTKASHGLSSSHVANMNFASTSDYIILDAEL